MTDILAQIHMDLAHRCVRQALTLARAGRNDEALEVANVAVDAYDKAVARSADRGQTYFARLAMVVPHPSERQPHA